MRLIDADSIHYTRVLSQQGLNMELAAKVVIDDMPTIDAAPVVHAYWIDRDGKTWCSKCGASNKAYKPPFCPHCGARMNKEE